MALIKCEECGQNISDKAQICPNCGAPVVEKIVCSECNSLYGENLKACPSCGCPNEDYIESDKNIKQNSTPKQDSKNAEPSINYMAENYWDTLKRWLHPEYIKMPSNTSPKMEAPKVDNDGNEVLDTNVSLLFIIEAFSLKLFWRILVKTFPILIVYAIIIGLLASTSPALMSIVSAVLGILMVLILVPIIFNTFIRTLIEYWDHIYLRFKELNIRYWRSMYKAMKDVKE